MISMTPWAAFVIIVCCVLGGAFLVWVTARVKDRQFRRMLNRIHEEFENAYRTRS